MPQLGQLGPLMAVIASCFTNLSLIHLTVCLPPCCNPSILIKSELNDQWRLPAADYHFSMLFRRNLQRAQATKPSRACLLSADACSKATIDDVFKVANPLFIDFWCSGSHAKCSVHLEAVDGLLKTHLNWNQKSNYVQNISVYSAGPLF